jgi:hypothetical protein
MPLSEAPKARRRGTIEGGEWIVVPPPSNSMDSARTAVLNPAYFGENSLDVRHNLHHLSNSTNMLSNSTNTLSATAQARRASFMKSTTMSRCTRAHIFVSRPFSLITMMLWLQIMAITGRVYI